MICQERTTQTVIETAPLADKNNACSMVSCPEHRQIIFSFSIICTSVLALFIITVLFIRNISKENITQYITHPVVNLDHWKHSSVNHLKQARTSPDLTGLLRPSSFQIKKEKRRTSHWKILWNSKGQKYIVKDGTKYTAQLSSLISSLAHTSRPPHKNYLCWFLNDDPPSAN